MKTLTFQPDEALHLVEELTQGARNFTAPLPAISEAIAHVPGVGAFGTALLTAVSATTDRLICVSDTAQQVAAKSGHAIETMVSDDDALAALLNQVEVHA
ncbi:MAG: hypothetical protein SPI77_00435 [Corynebacterium sp.]|nr:hypothetical protein [Corynebacterium sp.]